MDRERAGGSIDQPVMENSSKEVTIEDLPNEIITEIFSYIEGNDLARNVRHVSQRWQAVVDETQSLWKNYTLRVSEGMGMEGAISLIRNMPLLKRFETCSFTFNGTKIACMLATYCRVLTVMIIPQLWISGDCMELIIERFPCLSELHFSLNSQMDRQVKAVSRSRNLKSLHLYQHVEAFAQTIPGLFESLAEGSPNLSVLFFNYTYHRTQDINYLLEKKKDKLVSLGWKGGMHSTTFVSLGKCTVLKDIMLENIFLTDRVVTSNNIPDVNLANVERIRYAYSPIGYLVHLILASLPSLTDLNIKGCTGDITAAFSVMFPKCENLQNLILNDVMVNENVFTLIESRVLKKLYLDSCYQWGLNALKHLTDHCIILTELSISKVTIIPDIGYTILNMHQLEKIYFNDCDLVEMDFRLLCHHYLPNLKFLRLKNCILHSAYFNHDDIARVRPKLIVKFC